MLLTNRDGKRRIFKSSLRQADGIVGVLLAEKCLVACAVPFTIEYRLEAGVAIPGSPYRGQNWKIGKMRFLGSKMPFWGSLLEPFKWAFCGI